MVVILHDLSATLTIIIYYVLRQHKAALYQGLKYESLRYGLLDLTRQNNSAATYTHISKADSTGEKVPSVFLREMLSWELSEKDTVASSVQDQVSKEKN